MCVHLAVRRPLRVCPLARVPLSTECPESERCGRQQRDAVRQRGGVACV